MIAAAREIHAQYPPTLDDGQGVGLVIRSGEAQLHPDITDEMINASARDPEHLRIIQALRLQSAMMVPLTAGAAHVRRADVRHDTRRAAPERGRP